MAFALWQWYSPKSRPHDGQFVRQVWQPEESVLPGWAKTALGRSSKAAIKIFLFILFSTFLRPEIRRGSHYRPPITVLILCCAT